MSSRGRGWSIRISAPIAATTLLFAAGSGGAAASSAGTEPSASRLRTDADPAVSREVRADAAGKVRPAGWGVTRSAVGRARVAPAAPSPAAPTSSFRFDAIRRTQDRWPGDPTGAVGDGWFLTAVNSSFALYDDTGSPSIGPSHLSDLLPRPPPNGTELSEPKIVFDQYERTFVLVFLGTNVSLHRSWIYVVSIPNATATDQTTWCETTILADRTAGDGPQYADYPGLGYDADRVAISSNQSDFGSGGAFRFAQILSFSKASLYDCSRSNVRYATFTGSHTRNPDGSQAFAIQPATTAGGISPRVQYLLSFEPGKPNFVVVWRVREAAGGRPTLTNAAVQVPLVRIGPYGTQGGGSLTKQDTWWDPGDLRFVNAFYDADRNHVYAANAVGKDLKPDTVTGGYTESVVHWYEVRPSPGLQASRVTRSGFVGAPETDAGWPVLATDAAGNLFVTYARASAVTGEYLSTWVAEIASGSTAAHQLLLEPGTARFEKLAGVETWGSYAGISRDPVSGVSVTVVNQYASADGGATTDHWQESVDVVSDLG